MATSAITGRGTVIELSADNSTWTGISEVKDWNLSGMENEKTEVTHFASPGRSREYIPGAQGAGTATFSINYVEGQFNTLWTLYVNATYRYLKATYPDSSYHKGYGFISNMTLEANPTDGMVAEITFEYQSRPDFTQV